MDETENKRVSAAENEAPRDKSSSQHAETVAKHYNELQEAGLESRTQSRIFYLRNFNNWIKSVLIGETVQDIRRNSDKRSLVVLDLCSGKGGDLLKWKKAGISKLVCADIAGTSVEQCESRYKEMVNRNHRERHPLDLFTAEFITADCTKIRLREKYIDASMKFDLVSCQFSFHYCFESLPQAQMMVKNACECLELGGYFIGTTPNSNEIIKRLRLSDGSIGNEVYKITYDSEDLNAIPLFGAKYNFHLEGVVDCPEFFVYFPVLEKLAEEYGMKLVFKTPFAEYFMENVEKSEHRSLLGRMQALETYPTDEELMGKREEEYRSTSQQYEQYKATDDRPDHFKQRGPPKVGTLSQSEWEATTIYCVFAFQKVFDKNTGRSWKPANRDEHISRKRTMDHSATDTIPEKEQKVT